MDEGRVCCIEESLNHGAETRLSFWPTCFAALITSQQRLEVDTFKFWSPIDHHQLWETMIPMDTLTQDHHAGAVRRFIKGQVHRQQPPGKRVGQKRGPRSAKML